MNKKRSMGIAVSLHAIGIALACESRNRSETLVGLFGQYAALPIELWQEASRQGRTLIRGKSLTKYGNRDMRHTAI
jgi:hypothetical protein